VKKMVNMIMDCTNTPPEYWLLCLFNVTYLLNRLAVESLNWRTPLQVAHGQRPDISALLLFRWFEPVIITILTMHLSHRLLARKLVVGLVLLNTKVMR